MSSRSRSSRDSCKSDNYNRCSCDKCTRRKQSRRCSSKSNICESTPSKLKCDCYCVDCCPPQPVCKCKYEPKILDIDECDEEDSNKNIQNIVITIKHC